MDWSSQVKSFTNRTLRTERRYSLHSGTADLAFGCKICKVGSVSRYSRNSRGKSMICAGGRVQTQWEQQTEQAHWVKEPVCKPERWICRVASREGTSQVIFFARIIFTSVLHGNQYKIFYCTVLLKWALFNIILFSNITFFTPTEVVKTDTG